MIDFTVALKPFENFTPRSLMYKYAKAHAIETYRSPFDDFYFVLNGFYYGYDHYTIEITPTAEIVTVSLRLCY